VYHSEPLDERRRAADDPIRMADDRAFEIRPPAPAEIRACRMLLPHATGPGHKSNLLVAAAAAGDPPRVIGAAAMTVQRRGDDERGVVDLHVIPPCRRRGIARALLDGVLKQAQALDLASLRAWDWTPTDSEAATAWAALGFVPLQHRRDYQIQMVDALATLSPLLERVRARIPAGARVVSLAEADLDAVIRLHEQFLGGNAGVLRPMLSGSAQGGYNRDLSTVLLLDDEVVGIALGRTFGHGDTCEVDSRALHPSVRRRWANLWILHEGLRRGLAAGLRVMRYFTLDEHEDTRQLSERFGGVLIAESVRMGLELRPPRRR
jgi:ribosomal protein S18 acetylase RimI-like enzyme